MKEEQPRSTSSRIIEVAKKLHKSEDGMLILTRKIDQGIVISGNILVRVLGVERDRVKIGISAPGEITVLRQELWVDGGENQRVVRQGDVTKKATETSAITQKPEVDNAPQD